MDLLNVRASLGGLDFDGTAGADLDASSVYFTGHSLGTIVGAPFVAVANESSNPDDDIVAAQLLTPGAGIVRLLENSPAFAPEILGGLQAAVTQTWKRSSTSSRPHWTPRTRLTSRPA